MKSRSPQARQPARGFEAETSARSFRYTSKDIRVRRIRSFAPTRNFRASHAGIELTRLTAEFRIPAVNLVSSIAACEARSEEHTSELQSREKLVCRPLL